MPQPPIEDHIQTPTPSVQTVPPPASGQITVSRRNLISIAAAALFFSFFLPWATFLGATLSGLDIQKQFQSGAYGLVWVVPFFALISLVLNLFGLGTDLIRRLAGIFPFVFLFLSLQRFGTDFFKILAPGAWLTLLSAAVLIGIPNQPKKQPAKG